jgi:hypothetical protein
VSGRLGAEIRFAFSSALLVQHWRTQAEREDSNSSRTRRRCILVVPACTVTKLPSPVAVEMLPCSGRGRAAIGAQLAALQRGHPAVDYATHGTSQASTTRSPQRTIHLQAPKRVCPRSAVRHPHKKKAVAKHPCAGTMIASDFASHLSRSRAAIRTPDCAGCVAPWGLTPSPFARSASGNRRHDLPGAPIKSWGTNWANLAPRRRL